MPNLKPRVNFINISCTFFSYKSAFLTRKSSQNVTFVQKTRAKKVDEIDGKTLTFLIFQLFDSMLSSDKHQRYVLFGSCFRPTPRLLLRLALGPNNDMEQLKDPDSFRNSNLDREKPRTKQ